MFQQPTEKPMLKFTFTNSFGDTTEVVKDLNGDAIENLFWAIRDCLAGCGFSEKTIEDWFSAEN